MARVLDHRDLHPQADAEVRHAVLAGVAHGPDLPFDAAFAESAGDEDRVRTFEAAGPALSISSEST